MTACYFAYSWLVMLVDVQCSQPHSAHWFDLCCHTVKGISSWAGVW